MGSQALGSWNFQVELSSCQLPSISAKSKEPRAADPTYQLNLVPQAPCRNPSSSFRRVSRSKADPLLVMP